MKRTILALASLTLMAATPTIAAEHQGNHGGHASFYAGQQTRGIKALSAEDVAALRAGQGWGLAKPAELNGVPGPRHVLDMSGKLGLAPQQSAAVETLFASMRAGAIPLGERLLALEGGLERSFSRRQARPESLRAMLLEIGQARAELRYVHLKAHLETVQILTPEQIALYNRLRGYD